MLGVRIPPGLPNSEFIAKVGNKSFFAGILLKMGIVTKMNKSKPVKDLRVIDEDAGGFSLSQIKKFINEVKVEATKIVWPERKVTIGLTAVVVILSAVASLYLGTVDLLLGKIVASLLN